MSKSHPSTSEAGQKKAKDGTRNPHYSNVSGGGGEQDWHHSHNPKLNSRTNKA